MQKQGALTGSLRVVTVTWTRKGLFSSLSAKAEKRCNVVLGPTRGPHRSEPHLAIPTLACLWQVRLSKWLSLEIDSFLLVMCKE